MVQAAGGSPAWLQPGAGDRRHMHPSQPGVILVPPRPGGHPHLESLSPATARLDWYPATLSRRPRVSWELGARFQREP